MDRVACRSHLRRGTRRPAKALVEDMPHLKPVVHNAGETAYPRVASWKEVRDHFARFGAHS